MAILSGHSDSVGALCHSSDGTLLVSGSKDRTLKLWDVQTGGVIKTFCSHSGDICSVSISPNNATIVSGSHDRTIRLWNIQTGQRCRVIRQSGGVTYVDFFSSDPQYFISVSGGAIQQWDINGHEMGPKYKGSHAVLSSDGTYVVASGGGVITIQNSNSRAIVAQFQAESDMRHYCISPDNKLVAVATRNTIYIWDITNSDPHLVKTLARVGILISSLTFSSPLVLISASWDDSVMFWQITAPSPDSLMVDPKLTLLTSAQIISLTLQVKSGIAISCDLDGVVKTWDISTGLCKTSFQTPNKGSPADTQLIGGRINLFWYADNKIHVWDIEKGELLQTMGIPGYMHVLSLRVSRDGSKVFLLCSQFIQVWSTLTGEIVHDIRFGSHHAITFLHVDNLRAWVTFLGTHSPSQGWDFGIPDSPPVPLPGTPTFHLSGTKHWDAITGVIRDTITGNIFFSPPKFLGWTMVRWDGQYLVSSSGFGEVLILDFNHVFPQ